MNKKLSGNASFATAVIALFATVALGGCVGDMLSNTSLYVRAEDLLDFSFEPTNPTVYQKVNFVADFKEGHSENKGFQPGRWGWGFGDEDKVSEQYQAHNLSEEEVERCQQGNAPYACPEPAYEPCVRDYTPTRYGTEPQPGDSENNRTKNPTAHFYCEAGEYEITVMVWGVTDSNRFTKKTIVVLAAE